MTFRLFTALISFVLVSLTACIVHASDEITVENIEAQQNDTPNISEATEDQVRCARLPTSDEFLPAAAQCGYNDFGANPGDFFCAYVPNIKGICHKSCVFLKCSDYTP